MCIDTLLSWFCRFFERKAKSKQISGDSNGPTGSEGVSEIKEEVNYLLKIAASDSYNETSDEDDEDSPDP